MENERKELLKMCGGKKYNVVYADPAWQYGSKELYGDKTKGSDKRENRFRTIERIYTTMTIDDIKQLPVKEITDKNCACFMWVTDSHLKEGIEVMEAWGFKYKTIAFVWLKKTSTGKTVLNFAPHTLKSTEICLLGIKGSMKDFKKSNNVRQLIELFARTKIENWDAWGNETDKFEEEKGREIFNNSFPPQSLFGDVS
jgi:site-specific DNA-methyltransferase (adenine-specific)